MNLAAQIPKVGLWLAPITPAYFISRSMSRHLETPLAVAIVAGVTVEVVGVAISHAAVRAYAYNREKRKIDSKAPFLLALLLAIGYLLIGISLTTALELWPDIASIAPSVFFLLAAIAYVTLALHTDQARREREISQDKSQGRVRTAFWKVVKERGLSKAEGELALVQGLGDPVKALELLPERFTERSAERPRTPLPVVERSLEADGQLQTLAERSDGQPFKRMDVERWTGRAKTSAAALIKYGLDTDQVEQVGQYQYAVANHKGPTSCDDTPTRSL